MTRLDETMRHYCEQQAQRAGVVFRLACQFLPERRAERVVVTTAFIETLESIASDISDPGIAATKLEWWQQALSGASEAGERHPLVGALRAHRQLSDRRAPLFEAQVGAVGAMIDPEPVATPEALYERLSAAGMLRSLIIADADMAAAPKEAMARHGVVSIAVRQLASSLPELRAGAWWVPMNWRARFATDEAQSDAVRMMGEKLLAESASLFAAWQETADSALTDAARHCRRDGPLLDFLAIESGLRLRWLRRIASKPSMFLQGVPSSLRWRDAWFGWRRARRVAPRDDGVEQ